MRYLRIYSKTYPERTFGIKAFLFAFCASAFVPAMGVAETNVLGVINTKLVRQCFEAKGKILVQAKEAYMQWRQTEEAKQAYGDSYCDWKNRNNSDVAIKRLNVSKKLLAEQLQLYFKKNEEARDNFQRVVDALDASHLMGFKIEGACLKLIKDDVTHRTGIAKSKQSLSESLFDTKKKWLCPSRKIDSRYYIPPILDSDWQRAQK